ncbi:uncharacterized protein C11orf42-like [Brachyhypopomus gauderio]|uniref:uncharacterized protein C11orf42-like n=1 Tax=Brachyhypopomus gauderio TaxID=698409 RepID=UPI0040420C42
MASASSVSPDSLKMETVDKLWQCVRMKVVSRLFGPRVTAVPSLQDACLFHPLCVIGKRVERSLPMRKVRSLFPLGPLLDLMDDPGDPTLTSDAKDGLRREAPVHCNFLHEQFLSGVGHIRVQVRDFYKESQAFPMAPRKKLYLRSSLPWLHSVRRLYLLSEVFCSSTCRLQLLGSRCVELHLEPDTPLGFTCLKLSVSPSGLVEVQSGREDNYPHPQARWAKYGSAQYISLVGGDTSEQRVSSLLSQIAFFMSHPSTLPVPRPARHMPGRRAERWERAPHSSGYRQVENSSEDRLLPDEEDSSVGVKGCVEDNESMKDAQNKG